MIGSGAPINAGAIRPIDIVAPPGTVVNVRHPGACVGGQTELQPRIVDLIQGRVLSQVAPERLLSRVRRDVAATSSSGASIHGRGSTTPTTTSRATAGEGARRPTATTRRSCPHGNCRNTPVEVFETRYPWFTECYRLNADAGGPGRTRGGLGITRLLHCRGGRDRRERALRPLEGSSLGRLGGDDGDRLAYLVRTAGSSRFRTFSEAFGTPSDTKFSNVRLHRGDVVMLRSPSGGGYGPPWERPPEHVAEDVVEGYVTRERASSQLRRRRPGGRHHRSGRYLQREDRAEVGRWAGLTATSPGTISRLSTAT